MINNNKFENSKNELKVNTETDTCSVMSESLSAL